MKLSSVTYSSNNFKITVSKAKDFEDHISVHEYGEPCSGILKHWGRKADLIKELEEIIEAIKQIE